jgi:hypothetical protein
VRKESNLREVLSTEVPIWERLMRTRTQNKKVHLSDERRTSHYTYNKVGDLSRNFLLDQNIQVVGEERPEDSIEGFQYN